MESNGDYKAEAVIEVVVKKEAWQCDVCSSCNELGAAKCEICGSQHCLETEFELEAAKKYAISASDTQTTQSSSHDTSMIDPKVEDESPDTSKSSIAPDSPQTVTSAGSFDGDQQPPEVQQPVPDDDAANPPDGPEDRLGNNEWCRCGNCLPVESNRACVCCQESALARKKAGENKCVTLATTFLEKVLDREVLELSCMTMSFANTVEELSNKNFRFCAYQRFVYYLVMGKLGKRIRKVIPSCVVWKIRHTYPEESGQYKGHEEGDEVDPFFY